MPQDLGVVNAVSSTSGGFVPGSSAGFQKNTSQGVSSFAVLPHGEHGRERGSGRDRTIVPPDMSPRAFDSVEPGSCHTSGRVRLCPGAAGRNDTNAHAREPMFQLSMTCRHSQPGHPGSSPRETTRAGSVARMWCDLNAPASTPPRSGCWAARWGKGAERARWSGSQSAVQHKRAGAVSVTGSGRCGDGDDRARSAGAGGGARDRVGATLHRPDAAGAWCGRWRRAPLARTPRATSAAGGAITTRVAAGLPVTAPAVPTT